jgi:Dolichyl-phosphate-mannose-protein mannosyltransferase
MAGVALACVPLVVGWVLVRAVGPPGARDWAHRVLDASLAVGLGLGLSSCAFFIARALGASSRWALIASDFAILLAASGLLVARRRREPPARAEGVQRVMETDPVAVWTLGVAACVVALGSASAFVLKAARLPHGDWDGWAIWNLRARFLFRSEASWLDAFSPVLSWSHPDYPLLVPAAIARAWTYVGGDVVAVPVTMAALFGVATAGLLWAGVAVLRGAPQGLVALVALLGTPVFALHAASQYADIPLGYLILATLVLLSVHDRMPRGRSAVAGLAGGMLGLAAWTKNEGSLALVAVLLGRFAALAWAGGWRAGVRQMVPLLAGLTPVLAVLVGFRLWVAPPGDLLQAQALEGAGQRLLDGSRYGRIALAFARRIAGFGFAEYMVGLLILYALLMGRRADPGDRASVATGAMTLAVMLLGFGVIYVITPKDLAWHLDTSLWRLLLQLWPSALFVYCLIVNAPGPRRAPSS